MVELACEVGAPVAQALERLAAKKGCSVGRVLRAILTLHVVDGPPLPEVF